VNHYEWGSFKGDPSAWMAKYFDAFLYVTNWGTRELMLRFPRRVLDPAAAKRYCCGESASAKSKGDFVILEFLSEDEQGEDWDDDGSGWLSVLIPLRAEIAGGDHRALYLAWLGYVQEQALENRKIGPQVPPGLDRGDKTGKHSVGPLIGYLSDVGRYAGSVEHQIVTRPLTGGPRRSSSE
jgi:hypothetical protein